MTLHDLPVQFAQRSVCILLLMMLICIFRKMFYAAGGSRQGDDGRCGSEWVGRERESEKEFDASAAANIK